LKLKSDFEDRRLLHALVLAWVTIVWHDAKAEYAEDKAREIGKTMSWKQRLEFKLNGTSKTNGIIS